MIRIALAALPLAFTLAACGGTPAEEAQDVQEEQMEAAGDILDEQAEQVEAEADTLDDAGDEAGAEALEDKAEAMEDTADGM